MSVIMEGAQPLPYLQNEEAHLKYNTVLDFSL